MIEGVLIVISIFKISNGFLVATANDVKFCADGAAVAMAIKTFLGGEEEPVN